MPQQRVSASPIVKKPGESLLVSVDFSLYGLRLNANELLVGTPVITTPDGITASNPTVNTAVFTNQRGREVPAGRGVQFVLTGGTDGESYSIGVACGTNGSPAQTLDGTCPVDVKSED